MINTNNKTLLKKTDKLYPKFINKSHQPRVATSPACGNKKDITKTPEYKYHKNQCMNCCHEGLSQKIKTDAPKKSYPDTT